MTVGQLRFTRDVIPQQISYENAVRTGPLLVVVVVAAAAVVVVVAVAAVVVESVAVAVSHRRRSGRNRRRRRRRTDAKTRNYCARENGEEKKTKSKKN